VLEGLKAGEQVVVAQSFLIKADIEKSTVEERMRPAMLERLIGLSIRHRWLTLVLTAALVALGVWSYRHLSIDATPDITNVQVQINTRPLATRRWRPSSE
jgi:hypothetical protein